MASALSVSFSKVLKDCNFFLKSLYVYASLFVHVLLSPLLIPSVGLRSVIRGISLSYSLAF